VNRAELQAKKMRLLGRIRSFFRKAIMSPKLLGKHLSCDYFTDKELSWECGKSTRDILSRFCINLNKMIFFSYRKGQQNQKQTTTLPQALEQG